jgi:TolB-like protein/DNA-binding winged helix-turn-helix (wHTH) protein
LIEQSDHGVYRVGDLHIDTGLARVARDDVEIPLPKLSFDLLLALIRYAPQIASTDELMERVWSGLVVSPETVSQRVSLLRAALDDDPKQPKYIAVVRGRGYRLVAEVIRVAPDAEVGHDVPTVPDAQTTPGAQTALGVQTAIPVPRRIHLWLALALASLAIAAVLTTVAFRSSPQLTTAAHAPLSERSIAVLPFENVSGRSADDALALGIPEAVLHQLASVRELTVVARTSSFAFKGRNEDVRDIGRKLSVRYLLQGSVQNDGKQMRVTAQLVDSSTGGQVWSVRIDKAPRDIFAVQDEIAVDVARALKLSLDARVTDKLTGQGTANFDAYLAYLQGRAHAATLRISELKQAAAEFSHAAKLDPSFANAYVELADAELLVAEFDVSEDRETRFAEAADRGKRLVQRALQLDPANGHAYVARAYLRAFTDLAGAEADYRRGIALSPNYAKAYSGLAAILHENPTRWAETLEALDRARKLDPLEPQYDVTKAVFLMYRRSDTKGANELLVNLLQREPLYQPALMRLGGLRWSYEGRYAEAVKYCEQALSLDPLSEWTRRTLVRAYLDIGEPIAAEDVVRTAPSALTVRSIPLHLYRHEWRLAGEAAYEADDDGTLLSLDEPPAAAAFRMHARTTGEYARSIAALERLSNVVWDEAGEPHMPVRLGMVTAAVGLADVLEQSGDRDRARRLLGAILTHMNYAAKDLQRGDYWYVRERAMVLAMLGDVDGAIQALQRTFTEIGNTTEWSWFILEVDPVFDRLRSDPRFQRLIADARTHARSERAELARLRGEGIVPTRPSGELTGFSDG